MTDKKTRHAQSIYRFRFAAKESTNKITEALQRQEHQRSISRISGHWCSSYCPSAENYNEVEDHHRVIKILVKK